ncbi:DNA-binding MarR family transcriptional regulator [Actinoplanes tereljensis]|uniref:Transcriptional regulator, MarR family protein n=1 Tax=Paractinoplanes tereljensis TaxID=571912 RepID=A0A919NR54_9ACTN|nr:MarR family transcriptional regulator [Actinoplanes tereljensis]GIF23604.1 putative transcriptional regulator, MarR family protein [Actinoplanes tereljensis]
MPTADRRPDPIAEARRLWSEHGWEHAADGMAAITSLMRAQRIALARVEAVLKPHAITFARYELLMLLYFSRRGSLPMALISERLQVHPTSVTNAVDRLQAAGLVQRLMHPEDRRATIIELLPPGRKLAEAATADLNSQVFGAPWITPAAVTTLVDVITEIRHDTGDF